jgi:DNA-binding NarL/FixJ family response regulator
MTATLDGRADSDRFPSSQTIRIVLADDHGLMRAGTRAALESEGGFEVVGEVQHGAQVVPVTGRAAPDVVLLDLRMPGMDGLGCLERLQARHPEVKVVMCSVSADPDLIAGAFRRGACGYILKTINPIDLGSAIRQAVEGTTYHALGLPTIDDNTAPRAAGLTDRELEVVRAVARGLSNRDIAAELWVTVQTVKFHLTAVYRKLGITSRTEAARWAFAKGLAQDPEASP